MEDGDNDLRDPLLAEGVAGRGIMSYKLLLVQKARLYPFMSDDNASCGRGNGYVRQGRDVRETRYAKLLFKEKRLDVNLQDMDERLTRR